MRPSAAVLAQTIRAIVESPRLGESTTVSGWVRSVRRLKNVAFADVSDGTSATSLAVVMSPEQSKPLTTGSCVQLRGLLAEAPKGSTQQYELQLSTEPQSLNVLGPADSSYPLQKKYHSPEYLRSIPALRWKTAQNSAVLRYRSYAQTRMSQFFESSGFFQVSSPILTSSDCEGGGEVFSVSSESDPEFFGTQHAYLSVSSQLHLEVYAAALSRVWNMVPTFRAEKSDTNRHLSEFWMVEAELAFADSLGDVMDVAEAMVRSTVPEGNAADDLLASKRGNDEKRAQLQGRWDTISSKDAWGRISYTQAVTELASVADKVGLRSLKWGDDLSSEHEKFLAGEVFKGPVFVTDYPKALKAFYMKPSQIQDPQAAGPTVAGFDLLIPHMGELIGGSLREDSYDDLTARMKSLGMVPEDLDWYLDLRKYGSFPHGGYGMGFERLVSYMAGVENVREAIGFPRWAGSCVC